MGALLMALSSTATADTVDDCDICPPLRILPAGSFTMGSPEDELGRSAHEGPQRRVEIAAPFAIGVSEVSRREYSAFVAETGYPGGETCTSFDGLHWQERPGLGWDNPGFAQGEDEPVVCVSAEDISFYILWLNRKTGLRYRLPTEAEWEYAARAGTETRFPHGDDLEHAALCAHANGPGQEANIDYRNQACRDAYAFTAPPEAFPPNGFGLRNMLGNALEWTSDCYTTSYAADARRDCRFTVLRGGNWAGAPEHMRPAARGLNPPTARWSTNGFRIARDLPPS